MICHEHLKLINKISICLQPQPRSKTLSCQRFLHLSKIHIFLITQAKVLGVIVKTSFFSQSESGSEVARSCLTLCDPMNYSLPGSLVHGIFQE